MTSHDLTAPFDPSVSELVTGFHETRCYMQAYGGPLVEPVRLGVIGGRLSLDEDRSPHVVADVVCSLPQSAELIEQLDPRQGVRVTFHVGYVLPTGAVDEHQLFDLALRERAVSRRDEMTLSLASDESLVIDASDNVAVTEGGDPGDPSTMTKTDTAAWLAQVIQEGLWNPGAPEDVDVIVSAPNNLVSQWPVDVSDFWTAIAEAADQTDLAVYDPGDRVFRIHLRQTVASASVLTIKGGPSGVLLEGESTIGRDEWANAVHLRYEWRTAAGVDKIVYGTATVTGGPFAVSTVGHKILGEVRNVATTTDAANTAARTVLARLLSRSRGLRVTTVPCWWVRPGQTVTYYPSNDGASQRHIVGSVDHDLSNLTMSLRTRLPDNDSTIGE